MSKPNLFNRRSNSNNSNLRESEGSDFRYKNDDSDDLIGIYLKEVAPVPLLTKDQEVELFKRIKGGREASEILTQESMESSISVKRQEELKNLIEDGWAARKHLVLANQRLIVKIAKKYRERGVPFLDLIQEGNIGMDRAIKKFEWQRGYKFSTYGTWWIRQAVSRAVAEQGRTIRISVQLGDQIKKMLSVSNQFTQLMGRAPTIDELADVLDINTEKVTELIQANNKTISLESPRGDDDDSVLGDIIEDESSSDPIAEVVQKMLSDQLTESMNDSLSPREKRVLDLRYGLEDGISYTLEKIGQKLGVTKESVRQLERKALRRLRNPYNTRQLRDYLR